MHKRGLGHVNGIGEAPSMGRGRSRLLDRGGHDYGTERSRLRDGTRLVGDEGLDGSVGPVCGTELRGGGL